MIPHASELEISGTWININGKVSEDEACKRIAWLSTQHFRKIAISKDRWETLFQDPVDGRYWELTFPQSQLQGGGPPKLTYIETKDALARYGKK
jgi:hypothetical protein